MSLTGVVTARCPFGCEPFATEVWSVIRGDLDPELKVRLLAGEINLLSCPHCDRVFYYEHTLIYLDADRELLAFIYPESYAADEARWRERMREDFQRFKACAPKSESRVDFEPCLFFGLAAFREMLTHEQELLEEYEVAEAVARGSGLAIYRVRPGYARGKGIPDRLPLAGGGSLEQRLREGLKRLLALNGRLTRYARMLEEVERSGQPWEDPPQDRPRSRGPEASGSPSKE